MTESLKILIPFTLYNTTVAIYGYNTKPGYDNLFCQMKKGDVTMNYA